MNNKYYIPDIEEFHVGFRYEESWGVPNVNQEWLSTTFKEDNSIKNLVDIIRVKYLDISDIKELGWIDTSSEHVTNFTYNKKYPIQNELYEKVILQTIFQNNKIIISGYETNNTSPKPLFIGTCKNYNELKRIMEQVFN